MGRSLAFLPPPEAGRVVETQYCRISQPWPHALLVEVLRNTPRPRGEPSVLEIHHVVAACPGAPRKVVFDLTKQRSMPSARSARLAATFPFEAQAVVGARAPAWAFRAISSMLRPPYPVEYFFGAEGVERAGEWLRTLPTGSDAAYVRLIEPGIACLDAPSVSGRAEIEEMRKQLVSLPGAPSLLLVNLNGIDEGSDRDARLAFNELPLRAVGSVIDSSFKGMLFKIWTTFSPPPFVARCFSEPGAALDWLRAIRDDSAQGNK